MLQATRLISSLALSAALLTPTAAVAQDGEDMHVERVREPDPIDFDSVHEPEPRARGCTHYRDWDPMPLPEMVVDSSASAQVYDAPDIHAGLERAAMIGDVNGDGVVAICVEPGVYPGGFLVALSQFKVPVVLYSSQGADHTFVRGGKTNGEVVHAIAVSGQGAQITHHRDWRRDAYIQGLDVSGYGDAVIDNEANPYGLEGHLGEGDHTPDPEGGLTLVDGGAALLCRNASLSLRRMRFEFNQDGGPGGAVRLTGSDVYLGESELRGNFSRSVGGAVSAEDSPLEVGGSEFEFNYADAGGALSARSTEELRSTLRVYGSVFDGNEALSLVNGANDGGAIEAIDLDWLRLRDATFSNNRTAGGLGGAVYAFDVGEVFDHGSRWSGNQAFGGLAWGGALAVFRSDVFSQGASFSGNEARAGGALYVQEGELILTEAEFGANVARDGEGGGAWLDRVDLVLDEAWFHGNEATEGGGLALNGRGLISRSLFEGNFADGMGAGVAWLDFRGVGTRTLGVSDTRFIGNRLRGVGVTWQNPDAYAYGAGLACHLLEADGDKGTLSIDGGRFEDNRKALGGLPSALHGGGLSVYYGCNAELVGTTFHDNAAHNGGGIFAHSTSLLADQLTMTENHADGEGGAINFDRLLTLNPNQNLYYLLEDAELWLSNSDLLRNTAHWGAGLAVDCHPTDGPAWQVTPELEIAVELSDVDVIDNVADNMGGGVSVDRCRLVHQGGNYVGNVARYGSGGAIFTASTSAVELSQLRILDNETPSGAGSALRLTVAEVIASNLLVAGNEGDGPAVFIHGIGFSPSSALEHLTIAHNRLVGGGLGTSSGLHIQGYGAPPSPFNNLVSANDGLMQVSDPAPLPAGAWLVWHPPPATLQDVCSIDPSLVVFDDPLLTGTYGLGAGSPAAGAGVDAFGNAVDLGAFGGAGGSF